MLGDRVKSFVILSVFLPGEESLSSLVVSIQQPSQDSYPLINFRHLLFLDKKLPKLDPLI